MQINEDIYKYNNSAMMTHKYTHPNAIIRRYKFIVFWFNVNIDNTAIIKCAKIYSQNAKYIEDIINNTEHTPLLLKEYPYGITNDEYNLIHNRIRTNLRAMTVVDGKFPIDKID